MNFRRIEIFLAVKEAGAFTLAAERLRIAQSAVSIAIGKLEQELNTKLFDRNRRTITLTETGEVLARYAVQALTQFEDACLQMKALENVTVGKVVLGAPAMVAQFLLPGVLGRFVTRYPGVHLRVVQAGAQEVEQMVRQGAVDLGIIADWRISNDLEGARLAECPILACVPPKSPLARHPRLHWKDLIRQPIVAFPKGYHQRERLEYNARRHGISMNVVFEAENIGLLLEMVRRGIGITTLLAPAAQSARGVKRIPLGEDQTVNVAICKRRGACLSKAAAALHSHVVEALGLNNDHRIGD